MVGREDVMKKYRGENHAVKQHNRNAFPSLGIKSLEPADENILTV